MMIRIVGLLLWFVAASAGAAEWSGRVIVVSDTLERDQSFG